MKQRNEKKPLYRKVNTKARGVHHNFGKDFSKERNAKRQSKATTTGAMSRKKERGLDYTPLFKFLLSRVGDKWDDIFSEAKSRLDKTAPIFWLVALHEADQKERVRVGESTYYSGMYVDESGMLQLTNPRLSAENMQPICPCCTHTFNGVIFGKKYKDID